MQTSDIQGLAACLNHTSLIGWKGDFGYLGRPLEDGEIRVIKIHPGAREDVLKCSLRIIKPAGKLPYRALSYVWGDATVKERISIDEKDFWITRNLRDALCRIREKGWSFWIWIDAISINQTDTIERNSQVQQMGDIFSQAAEVLVWLGDAPDESSALEDVCHLSSLGEKCTKDGILEKRVSLRDVFSRTWFSRLWVLQEVSLAQRAAVMLGAETCTLNTLLSLTPILHLAFNTLDDGSPVMDLVQTNFNSLVGLRTCRTRIVNKSSAAPFRYCRLVKIGRRLSCQDPRDHIFGLTGIAKMLGIDAVETDYEKPIVEIYQLFMQNELLLDASSLIYFGSCDMEHNLPNLPSWVPNFSRLIESNRFFLKGYWAGGTSLSLKVSMESFSPDGATLALPGYDFDSIRALGGHYGGSMHKWILTHEKYFVEDCSDLTPYGDYLKRYNAFWRSLCGNQYKEKKASSSTWRQRPVPHTANGDAYEVLMKRTMPIPKHINKLEHEAILQHEAAFMDASSSVLRDRRFLLTSSGYFCIGPGRANIGDHIVVIPGLPMPVILRERSNNKTYQMLGPAYVHGIMDGEFIEKIQRDSEEQPEMFYVD